MAPASDAIVEKSHYRIFACAVLPDHVHLVLGRHRYKVESMVRLLKAAATTQLLETAGIRWGTIDWITAKHQAQLVLTAPE